MQLMPEATLHLLPTLNAVLNGASAVLIFSARGMIRRGQVQRHRKLMIAAVVTSSLFLISYLTYHLNVGSVHFAGQGWSRPVYFTILFTHTVLAASVPPLVLIALTLGLRRRDERHRRIARWAYPVWMYVSVTGVVIYVMLYHLFAAA
jgi:putative membrane protein